ncbi:hypothetical protein SDC9_108572 [bioreactor metagenome]|uniref:Uncharacterized protein n=1 Tax=bioreactor metagenome TaxID=1076179 RepID=A0A645B8H4_9ZZZZ
MKQTYIENKPALAKEIAELAVVLVKAKVLELNL